MAFSKIHVFLWFCKMPILVIPKTLRYVAFFGLLIPRVTPTIFRKLRFSKIHVFLWFCKMPILVILKTLRFVELLGLVMSRPPRTILRKQRFGKTNSIGNLLVWPAPDSPIPYFLGIFADLVFHPGLLWLKMLEGDGADRARVIGLIRTY